MGSSGGGSGPGPMVLNQTGDSSNYSLPEAVSKIQMYSLACKLGEEIPEGFVVFKEKISLWVVGFKGIWFDILIAALFTPFSLAVMNHLIPIFGTYEPNAFDKVFACVLSGAYSLGFNVMLAFNLGTCYFGRVPIVAIRTMLGGFLSANVIKLIVLFPWFHFLPDWFNPDWMSAFFARHWLVLEKFMTLETAQNIVGWMVDLREVFIRSWYLVFAMTVVSFVIPFAVFVVGKRKARREYDMNVRYDVI